MLSKFRNTSNSFFVKIILGLIILSFAGWGLSDVFIGNTNQTVAKIGNKNITAEMLNQQFEQDIARISQSFGFPISREQAIQFGLLNRSLQGLVQKSLIELEAESVGIMPSDETLLSMIKEDSHFHDKKGDFSPELFKEILTSNRLTERVYLDFLKADLQKNLLTRAISLPITIPNIMAKALYSYEHEMRAADIYRIGKEAIGKLAVPSMEQLQVFYETHQSNYMQEEMRAFSLLEISKQSILDSINTDNASLQTYYKEHKNSFKLPEKRSIEQIITEKQEDINKIAEALDTGTDSFKAIADQYNGTFVALKDVSRKDLFFPILGKTVFELEVGKISTPVETPIGWMIVKVNQLKASQEVPFAKVKADVKTKFINIRFNEKHAEMREALEDALDEGTGFQALRKQYQGKLITLTNVNLEHASSHKLLSKKSTKSILIQKAFAIENIDEKEMLETPDGSFYIFEIHQIIEPHAKDFETVQTNILADWTIEASYKQAQKLATAWTLNFQTEKTPMNKLRFKNKMAKYKLKKIYSGRLKRSGVFNEKKQEKLELSPYIIKDLFNATVGKPDFVDNNHAVYLYNVSKKIVAPMRNFKKEIKDIKKSLFPPIVDALHMQYLSALEKKYKVEYFPKTLNVVFMPSSE